jgi:nitrogen fixation/metabolism regulation signal transduction histidine kinase
MSTPVFKRIDIYKIIYDTIRLESLRSNVVQFNLSPSDSLYISGDERLLSQALINIFKNASEAIEYNAIQNGNIHISFEVSDTQIIIYIVDNGGGLPKEIPPHELFNPYVSTKDNGTGIGLAITGKIITDHNGHITLQNHTDIDTHITIGTKVMIHLPLEISDNKR